MSIENSLSVCMSNALGAAKEIHIALCHMRQVGNTGCQADLLRAMHSVFIIAEQCRQEFEAMLGGRPTP